MSSFDPPLSRTTAGILVIAAALVVAWILHAAATAPMRGVTANAVISATATTRVARP